MKILLSEQKNRASRPLGRFAPNVPELPIKRQQSSHRNLSSPGGIFDGADKSKQLAFKYAIKAINSNRTLHNHILKPIIVNVDPNSSLNVTQTTCHLLSQGVVAIFGPTSEENANVIQSICDTKEIPHIEARWNADQERGSCLVNVFPYPDILSKIFVDLVKTWQWKGFTILYEDDHSLMRISELLKIYDNQGYTITVKQLNRFETGYR